MSDYSSLSRTSVDGVAASSSQGTFLGTLATMPTATADHVGVTVLYQGVTNTSYTQGSLYKGVMEIVDGVNTYRWVKVDLTSIPVDTEPVEGSSNPISSGAVFSADYATNEALVNGLAGKQAMLSVAQMNAVNSGITGTKVSTYDGYASGKFNVSDMHTTTGSGVSAGITAADPIAMKSWVNSSISTNTATFRGTFNITGTGSDGLDLPIDASDTQIRTALNSKVGNVATNNDYVFIYYDYGGDGNIDKYDRWKYTVFDDTPANTGWYYEYTLNNSSFTSNQWAAINSGITAAMVSTLDNKIDTAGTGLSKTGTTLNHSNSVTANTAGVGSTTAVPIIKYDAQGHITSVATATIYPPTTAGTAGQVWESDGSGQGVWVTKDTTPTANSTKPVTSGGVKSFVEGKGYTTNTGTVTTSGTMTSGNVVLSNGGVVIKDSGFTIGKSVPSNAVFTDTNTTAIQRLQTGNYNLPLLMSYQTNTSTTADVNNVAYRNNSIYANPSTGKITATAFVGSLEGNASTASTATKLGSTTVGNATQPIYLNAGVPTAGTALAAGAYRAVDTSPTANSTNLVTSGGIKTALTNGSVTKVGTATVGSATQPIYLNAGTPTAGNTFAEGAYKSMGAIASNNTGLVTGGEVYAALRQAVPLYGVLSFSAFDTIHGASYLGNASWEALTASNTFKYNVYDYDPPTTIVEVSNLTPFLSTSGLYKESLSPSGLRSIQTAYGVKFVSLTNDVFNYISFTGIGSGIIRLYGDFARTSSWPSDNFLFMGSIDNPNTCYLEINIEFGEIISIDIVGDLRYQKETPGNPPSRGVSFRYISSTVTAN